MVGGYKKIEDAFIDRYLTHEGETVEEAKIRLDAKREERRKKEQGHRDIHMRMTVDHVKRAQEKAHMMGRIR